MDDLNVDNYNIDDIFELVDVEKYDYIELMQSLDEYIEEYEKNNNIVFTNFIRQIKEKTDFIQENGVDYANMNTNNNMETNFTSDLEQSIYGTNNLGDDLMGIFSDIAMDTDTSMNPNRSNTFTNYADMDNQIRIKNNDVINDVNNDNNLRDTDDANGASNGDETNGNNILETSNDMNIESTTNTELNDNGITGSGASIMEQPKLTRNNTYLESRSTLDTLLDSNKSFRTRLNQLEQINIEKTLVFNSEFRKASDAINDYVINLDEDLVNVTSLKLISYAFTYNIYNIDAFNNTNIFYITDTFFEEHRIEVKSGFYSTPQQLIENLNSAVEAKFTNMQGWTTNKPVEFSYDELQGKVSIKTIARPAYYDLNTRTDRYITS